MVKLVDGYAEGQRKREEYMKYHNLAVSLFGKRVSVPSDHWRLIAIYSKAGHGEVFSLEPNCRRVSVSFREHLDEARTLAEKCEQLAGKEYELITEYKR